MDINYILGIIGMICILFAFIMGTTGRWKHDDIVYDIVNLVGSVLLIVYSIAGRIVPFIVLNAVWAVFSLYDIVMGLTGQHHKKQHMLKPREK